MQFSSPAWLITPSGVSLFNQDYTTPGQVDDHYFITAIDGLDGFPVSAPEDPLAQTDGGLLHDFFARPRHITVTGILIPGNGTATRRNAMEKLLRIRCRSMLLNGDEGRWEWLPDGESAKSLIVKCDVQPTFPGEGVVKQFIFGLVAANPFYDEG